MASEKLWDAVAPVSFTADGGPTGLIQVTDTIGFYYGMACTIKNNTQQLTVFVKGVLSNTMMLVGSSKGNPDSNVNLTAFTIASGSQISAAAQNKPSIPMESRLLATYMTDPINAWRTFNVDPYGKPYTDSNPVPVAFSGSISIANVGIIGPGPDNNRLEVNDDGSAQITGAGTAGTSDPGVVTVQGIAGGTPLPISGSITATNPSVSDTGIAPPAQATFIGTLVSAIAPTYADGTLQSPSLTLAGALRVDGSGVTQPISAISLPLPSGAATNSELVTINTTLGSPFQAGGSIGNTSFGATQSGAWNVGLNAGSNAIGSVTVSNFPASQPVSGTVTVVQPSGSALHVDVDSLPSLPAGANAIGSVSVSNFPSLQDITGTGTAGSPAPGVVTIQGIASGTPIPISGSITASNPSVTPTGTTPPAQVTFVGALVSAIAPAYIDGNVEPPSMTLAGALRVDGSAVTQPISATSLPLPTGAATNAELVTINTTLGSPFQAGGSIGNTSFGSSQVGTWNVGLNAGSNNIGSITNITGTVSLPTGAATNAELVTINSTLGSPFQAGGSIGNTSFGSSQIGTWNVGRTWTLNSATDSVTITGSITATNLSIGPTGIAPPADATYIGVLVNSVSPVYVDGEMQSLSLTTAAALRVDGSAVTQPISATSLPLPTGAATNAELVTINTTLGSPFQAGGSIGNTSFGSSQVGTWNVGLNSGTNVIGSISNTSFGSSQIGTWNVGLNAGSNNIGSITNITGTVSLPTGAATNAELVTINTTLGSPFQAGGSIGNTSFGSSQVGTWNVGLNAGTNVIGSIANTSFASTQSGTWNVGLNAGTNNIGSITNITGTISLPTGAATNSELVIINTTLGSPFQAGGSIGNTSFGSSQVGTWTTGRTWTLNSATDSVTVTGTVTATNPSVSATGTTPPADATYIGALAAASSPSLTAGEMYSLSLTLAGALRTDSSATTQPISATSLPLPTGAATNAELVTINTTLGTPFQAGGSIGNTSFGSSQVGTWTVQPGNTANTTPWLVTVATALPAGTNAIGSITNTSFIATQTTAANLNATVVGTGTFAVQSAQSGTWTVGLSAGANNIGSITNITGTVSLPTGAATNAELVTINTTLGSPFQVGGSIGNTSFGSTQVGTWTTGRTWDLNSATDSVTVVGTITATNASIGATGTTPPADATYAGALASASSPTLTAGDMYALSLTLAGALRVDGSAVTQPISAASLPLPTGAATNAELVTINTTLGSPFQAGGSIGNTSFGSTQVGTWTVQPGNTANTTPWLVTVATALPAGTNAIGSITNTSFIATQTTAANLNATVVGTGTFAVQSAQTGTWIVGLSAGTNNIGSITNITGTISLPTGAATNAELITINTTLGSPFQAGGSIGNTSFGSSQVGTWTTGRTWNLNSATDSVTVTGTVTATNPSVSATGTTPPADATYAGALASASSPSLTAGNMYALSLTLAGALRTDSSATTQPISAASLPLPIGAATNAELVTINTTLGSPFQAGGSIGNTSFGSTQVGTWTVQPGNTANTTPWLVTVATALPAGTNAIGSITNTSFIATQATAANLNATVVGTGTFAVQSAQSGTWNVGLNAGSNNIGSITNITGTVSLPTGAATNAELVTINTTLGSPFQAGGSIGNTSFGSTQVGTWTTGRTWNLNSATDSVAVTGTVTATNLSIGATGTTPPADATYAGALAAASSPSLTAGNMYSLSLTLAGALRVDGSAVTQPISAVSLPLPSGAATNAELITINTTLGTPFQAGGSIGNTSFGSSQVGTWTVQPGNTANTTPWLVTVATALPAGANVIGSIANTSFIATQATAANLNATVVGTGTFAVQAAQSGTWNVGLNAGTNNIGSITNITGTVSLPTGASTAALQTTGNTSLATIASAVLTQSSTTSGQVGFLHMGAVSASSPSYTAGNTNPLSLTLAGALRVDGSAVTQPISAASLPLPTGAATNAELVTINTTLGSPFQAGGAISNTSFGSSQVGTWTVQPGNTANTTPWLVTVATALPAGSNVIGSIANTSFIATQATAANLNATVVGTGTFAVQSAQSGTWTTGRTWTLASGTDSVSAVQSGTWNVGLNAGTNLIGSVNQGTSPWITEDKADGTPGSAAPTTAIQVGGTDGTNLRTLSVNPVGAAKVTYGPGTQDVFGTIVTGSRQLQINVQFNTGVIGQLVQYLTGAGGTATITSNGQAQFSTSTTTGSESTGISLSTTQYASGCEIYSEFTAAFTAPVAGTYQKIGLYNSTTGFYVGYIGTNFGVTLRALSTDTTVNQSSFNIDTLTGASNSLFTNAGVPVAINFTYLNVFRIRFGWLGAAPVYFEVLSPDGNWVTFHIIRQPNSATIPSIENPNLPMTIDVSNGSTTSNMVMTTACWGAGIVSPNTSQDLISYGSLSSTSGSVFLSGLNGAGSANVDVGGTFVGTLTVSESGQLNAKTLYLQNLANGALQTTITAPGNYRVVGVPATTQIAVNFTAYTSGTAEISIRSASSTYFTSPISLNPTNMLVTSYLNDGSGNAINSINSQLETADIINTALTVPTTLSLPTPGTAVAARVGSSNLANRKGIIIAPITATVYWGSTAGVTAATGIPIYPGQVVELTYGPNITIYLVSSVVNTVNIVEES